MRLAILACVVAFSLPLAADTVITTDGRTLTGEVTEDGDKIVVKMKIGTVKLDKAQVKEIKKDGAAGGAAPAAGGERTYKSHLLGYLLKVPTTKYVLQRVPPEPLVDVILYDSASESEIALGVCVDEEMPATFDAASARALGEAIKGGLGLYFTNLQVLSAQAVQLGPYDAARVVIEGQKRDNKRKQHLVSIFFRLRDQPMELRAEALLGKHKALDADCDRIVETLESFEPKEMDGDVYVDMRGCFSISKPAAWSFTQGPREGEAGFVVALDPATKCSVTAAWTLTRSRDDLRSAAKGFERGLGEATIESSKAANVKGRVAWEVRFKAEKPNVGRVLARAILFRTVDRLYSIVMDGPEGLGEAMASTTAPLFDSFEIYPDLLSKGSLDNGREARRLMRQADEQRIGGGPAASIPLYDQAIELYPPFAGAYNNRGKARLDQDQFDEAYKDMQTASELAPNDFLVSRNIAICRLTKAYKSLDEGRITSAIDEADRLRGRAKDDEELSEILGVFYFQVGNHYLQQEKPGPAKAFFKKGMEFYHDKQAVKQALSRISLYEAVEQLKKENWRAGKTLLEESLKYDPSNAQAQQLLSKVNEELSK